MASVNLSIAFRVVFFCYLILFSSENTCAHEGGVKRETMESHHQPNSHVIKISDLLPAPVCSTSTSTLQGLNDQPLLEVVHKHGPCSKLGPKHKGKSPIPTQILLEDQSRVKIIQSRIAKASRRNHTQGSKINASKQDHVQGSMVTIPAHAGSGRSLGTGNYIVTVGIGSPKRDFSLIFDTGSDLTWIQCQPCVKSCYTQQEPIFNPGLSSSYSNVTCNTEECSELKDATDIYPSCSPSSTCVYGIQYGDQEYSVGFFGRETLTLGSDVFQNFMFGCGQNNRGLFGTAAGLLGLGRNKLSMMSQTFKKYGGIFSYCLPSTPSSTGFLAFGHEVNISSRVKFTPLLVNSDQPSFYFLELKAISIGRRKLPIPATVFATSGTIIDSGTFITRLPPAAYSILRSAFWKSMSSYPRAEDLLILDTCYDFTGFDTITIPQIALHFRGGIAVEIDVSGVMYTRSASQVCLAFAGNSDEGDVAILGNIQQQKMDVIYDVARARLGFGPGGCS